MISRMTPDELRKEVAQFHFWYHKIDLGEGVVTPGLDFDQLWDMIRETYKYIDYKGKKVLDIGSWDGMWAFEAEKLGADIVIATDCHWDIETYNKFLFCREVLGSKVIPYFNISPYNLWNRLDVYLQENWEAQKPYDRLFDIVQHLGLLYHVRDPLLTLSQSRSVLRTGGYLLIETAAVVDEKASFMVFNGVPPEKPDPVGRIYNDRTTWWAPTIPCLREMLRATLFEPIEETIHILQRDIAIGLARKIRARFKRYFSDDMGFRISRVCLVARAVSAEDVSDEYFRELSRTYRNPGLVVEHLQKKQVQNL